MRANEFINADLDEGWKENLAAAATVGALAFGGHAIKPSAPVPQPQAQQVIKQVKPITGSEYELVLMQVAKNAGLKGDELAQFMAQCAHESMNFTRMKEVASKKHIAKAYHKKKSLGNKNPADAVKYKGRGYIQLTGKYNYEKAGQQLNIPLTQQPELAAQPEIAAKVALWYWNTRVSPYVNDFSDTRAVTQRINPGLAGLQQRDKLFNNYIGAV